MPTPSPSPLFDPNNIKISADILANRLLDVNKYGSKDLNPAPYAARIIKAQAVKKNPKIYDLQSYAAITIKYNNKDYRLPEINLVNFTSSDAKQINTAFAMLRYVSSSGLSVAAADRVLQQLEAISARGYTGLLTVSLEGASFGKSSERIGGQANTDNFNKPMPADKELETFAASTKLINQSGSLGRAELLQVVFHEWSHGTAIHQFAYDTSTPFSKLINEITVISIANDPTYAAGKDFIDFIASTTSLVKSSGSSKFQLNGLEYDVNDVGFSVGDVNKLFYGTADSTGKQGIFGAAREKYENHRSLLLSTALKSISSGKRVIPAELKDINVLNSLVQQGFLKLKSVPKNLTVEQAAVWGQDFSHYEVRTVGSKDFDGNGVTDGVVTGDGRSRDSDMTFAQSAKIFAQGVLNGITTFDGGQVGVALGSVLGKRLTSDPFVQVIASGALSTVLGALGEFIDIDLLGGTTKSTRFFDRTIDPITGKTTSVNLSRSFGETLFANIKGAGIGALSSYLTAELVQAVGLNGVLGEVVNSAGGAVIAQILTNLSNSGTPIFEGITNPTFIASVAASYLGGKLASVIYTPESVGGQIGSAVGAAYGSFVAAGILASGPLSPATFAAAVVAVAFWTVVGGLIGSIFGGTPRSGADAAWDATKGEFVVANIYARKGGSKDAAVSLANGVAGNLNAVLDAAGSVLLDPAHVQSGNYGMRKKDYVYRPISTTDKDAITARFSGKDGAQQLITHGTYLGISSMVGQLAGGDVYIKRALASSLANAGGNPATNAAGAAGQFDMTTLLGDVSTASDYASYLQNATAIDALIAADTQTSFSAGWLVTLARATELGLDRRGATDWTGGYVSFLDEIGDGKIDGVSLRATQLQMGIDDATGLRFWSVVGDDGDFLGYVEDTIETTTRITATASADTIDLRSGALANQIGYTVNGHLNSDVAQSGVDFTAKNTTLNFTGGGRSAVMGVATTADALVEPGETFDVTIGNAVGVKVVGPPAAVTIVAADAAPTLMVGRSYVGESEGIAFFRVSLSKAASTAVTLSLALTDGRATAGVDYGTAILVSADGNGGWASASTLTLAAGVTQYYVRVPVIADNGVGADGKPTNVEGNETFTLTATVTAGASALVNGTTPVSGIGTVIDGAASVPYAWLDDQVVHEGAQAALWAHRSKYVNGVTGSVQFATSDRTRLDIAVAATVDGGAGNDTIYGSNLGDNLFGGAGDDTLYGGRLDDWLLGGEGNDTLDAGTADAAALGGDGNYLDGGAGNDILRGREGSDWLEGGEGTDVLTGGAGDDILAGGAGDGDDLKGGTGADQYLVRRGDGLDVAEEDASGAPIAAGAGDAITQRIAAIEKWKLNPATAGALRHTRRAHRHAAHHQLSVKSATVEHRPGRARTMKYFAG